LWGKGGEKRGEKGGGGLNGGRKEAEAIEVEVGEGGRE